MVDDGVGVGIVVDPWTVGDVVGTVVFSGVGVLSGVVTSGVGGVVPGGGVCEGVITGVLGIVTGGVPRGVGAGILSVCRTAGGETGVGSGVNGRIGWVIGCSTSPEIRRGLACGVTVTEGPAVF